MNVAQIKAASAANTEQIRFYWETGQAILKQQETKQLGSRFLDQLSTDMRKAFPGMQGFSRQNLEHMRRFAQLYPNLPIAKQAVSQLPWGHVVRLMQPTSDQKTRDWYAAKTIEHGWSRSVMIMQIESNLFERQPINENKTGNFHEHLPKPQSDLAMDMLKDPYKFDFLTIQGKASERAFVR